MSRTARIAYLKRMMKRLEEEKLRLRELLSSGDLTEQAGQMGLELIEANRNKMIAELETLEGSGCED